MRGEHTFAYLLSLLFSKMDASVDSNNPHSMVPIQISRSRLWRLLEIVSTFPVILIRYLLPSSLGFWVVADRFVPDFIVWLALANEDKLFMDDFISSFLLKLTMRARSKVYVTAELKDLLQRRRSENPNFIKRQLRLYDELAALLGAYILNTSKGNAGDFPLEKLSVSIA